MVKQGHYAGVQSNKKRRSIRQRQTKPVANKITRQDVSEFIQGRYVLTQRGTSDLVDETMQRFLSTWLLQATSADSDVWDMKIITQQTFTHIANQVPWQFYAVIVKQWDKLSHFLIKEVPAVPVATPIKLMQQVFDIKLLISQQLAINWYLTRFNTESQLATIKTTDISQLVKSFVAADEIVWQNVAVVYSTIPFKIKTDDVTTKKWLVKLNSLQPEQV
ncbi:hypothetical protein ACFQGR_02520 [Weissella sagaensis]|uniref:Uncharacterized protein n=1 Tax=Weissella sagaensis TaxID=2559928 RepID=A0ABW1RSB7_9LACO|nr:hypothetical protein [Weissella sagaensis]MBU7568178.1 hypothetical protein [Weissella hellenica]QDJ58146.1 hypothetical protein EFA59_00805 [Weissella hellenica]QEA57143.1 hypothetical protein FGL75_04310 [Weissella hellenica]UEG66257.1 hypothetical protein GZH44_05580 [Weissella hellenica]